MGNISHETIADPAISVEVLLEKFQKGDEAAGRAVTQHINQIVARRLRRLTVLDDERDEIAQECAVTIIQRLPEFDSSLGSFEAWVSGFAHNCWRSHVRGLMRARRTTVAMDSVTEAGYEIEDQVNQRENLQSALEALEIVDQELLHMRYSLGMTSDEIALNSDMNAPQIRKRISRAIERLRRHPATQQLLMSIGAL